MATDHFYTLGAIAVGVIVIGAWWRRTATARIDPANNFVGAARAYLRGVKKIGKPVSAAALVHHLRANPKAVTITPENLDLLDAISNEEGVAELTDVAISTCQKMVLRLRALEAMRKLSFDNDNAAHTSMLEELWAVAFPGKAYERPSKTWGEAGFQGLDPITDLRGGGVLALRQFKEFGQRNPADLGSMIDYNRQVLADGQHHWFLTAVVSIQFTVQLVAGEHVLPMRHLETLYDNVTDADPFAPLHAEMLKAFYAMWQQKKPHVMEYTLFLPKFTGKFFAEIPQ